MKGVELGHHERKCSFEAFVSRCSADDPAILELAKIVHGADIEADRNEYPESVGL
ncbi:MAG: chromate resistance protein [Theionarchaea archaeon]|nr:chromate resistance protein [Theionarchaea archaeon]MBU7021872.1 chromate resistance protein [Theionarchaea archaeon]